MGVRGSPLGCAVCLSEAQRGFPVIVLREGRGPCLSDEKLWGLQREYYLG